MNDKEKYLELKSKGISKQQEELIERELNMIADSPKRFKITPLRHIFGSFYDISDFDVLPGYPQYQISPITALETLEDLLERDNQREKDGFPRRIRIGKLSKPSKDSKTKVVIVPSTYEPKFYHDDSVTEDEEATGGTGEGDEGEVIGEAPVEPQQGEGEGQGAGQGQEAGHDIAQGAFDLGKVLTEKFKLPNLKDKGRKRSFSKFTYDLTDRNRGFGQVLEKKETMKRIIQTNIQLGRFDAKKPVDTSELLITPQDEVYRILSREKDFETQAVVFFLRDYSGSMQGKPTEVISQQHLFIYSWLMFQYQNNVETRFILHDTEAKEVKDFYTYYQSQVAGGTRIAPAFALARKIIEEENLFNDYNIYIFHGTDGDDWDEDGKEMLEETNKLLSYTNRIGITVAKNSWSSSTTGTTIERYMDRSNLLKDKPQLIRLDSFSAAEANENRIINGIKLLVSE